MVDVDQVASRDAAPRGARPFVFGPEVSRPWLVANVVGFTIAGAVCGGVLQAAGGPLRGTEGSVMDAAGSQAVAAGLVGAINGVIIGAAQWIVLRHAIRAGWWMPATVLGWAVVGAILGLGTGGSTSSTDPMAPLIGRLVVALLFVLLHGSGQWLILRRDAEQAGWWPLFHAGSLIAAWLLGLMVAAAVPFMAGNQFPSARALMVVGVVSGSLYGWLTALFLAELRRRAD